MNLTFNTPPSRMPLPLDTLDQEQELKKRVLKLRWIGAESEAEQLTHLLGLMWPASFIVQPPETD